MPLNVALGLGQQLGLQRGFQLVIEHGGHHCPAPGGVVVYQCGFVVGLSCGRVDPGVMNEATALVGGRQDFFDGDALCA